MAINHEQALEDMYIAADGLTDSIREHAHCDCSTVQYGMLICSSCRWKRRAFDMQHELLGAIEKMIRVFDDGEVHDVHHAD